MSVSDDNSLPNQANAQLPFILHSVNVKVLTSRHSSSSFKEPLAFCPILLSTPSPVIILDSFKILVLWSQKNVPSMPLKLSFHWPPPKPCHHPELFYLWNLKSNSLLWSQATTFHFNYHHHVYILFQQDLQDLDFSAFSFSINLFLLPSLSNQDSMTQHINHSLTNTLNSTVKFIILPLHSPLIIMSSV